MNVAGFPDTEQVASILERRLMRFLSLILGGEEVVQRLAQSCKPSNKFSNDAARNGKLLLEMLVESFETIRQASGWKNKHVLSYATAILSWMEHPTDYHESMFTMSAIKQLLDTTAMPAVEDGTDLVCLKITIDDILNVTDP